MKKDQQSAGLVWDALNRNVFELTQQGDYDRAVVVALKALNLAEEYVGPDHLDVATSLNNLACIYQAQGQYAKTEPLLRRSLVIRENEFGPDHPNVAHGLNNLGCSIKSRATIRSPSRFISDPLRSGKMRKARAILM